MNAREIQELKDILDSMANKIETCFILIADYPRLLPTQLEHLYEDAQKIIDDYCIKKS